MTATPSANTASRMETLTELTTELTTSTLPNGQLTTIPTHTGTVTVITPLPTGKIEPNPILRNKVAIVGVIVAGVLIVVGGILVLFYATRKRRQRVLGRTRSPDTTYTERSGRVLIQGRSPSITSRPLTAQEWQPPLVSEVVEDERENEDEQFYGGQYQGPVTLPVVQRENYGSIMAAVHSYAAVGNDDSSRSSSVLPRRQADDEKEEIASPVKHLISFEEADSNTPRAVGQAGKAYHGWVQADISTPDPFADPGSESQFSLISPDTLSKYRPLSQFGASSSLIFSPLSSPKLFDPGVNSGEPNKLRGRGSNSTPSSAGIAVDPEPSSDFDLPSRPSSLLNPPIRPKFTGTLTDLAFSSGPPVLPPITPVASPGESIDSYHPDGLLDPALLESRSSESTERPGGGASLESLVDYVDYTRPISSIIFHRAPTLESRMEGVVEEVPEAGNARDYMLGSPAVRAYHNKLLGFKQNSWIPPNQ
ncbi:hypothetical protein F5876DRAFT_66581 [Lentinula aff. lateritia]|uniref:Uncharacterized protein n=1 Tax=Lentinula aff. lateritia TaxID=2804960 RepID=A0ACC1TX18_9AGAR|nr:hypothetical protein F5876DRAFT_66581 [Lentinula aff. lateritia]